MSKYYNQHRLYSCDQFHITLNYFKKSKNIVIYFYATSNDEMHSKRTLIRTNNDMLTNFLKNQIGSFYESMYIFNDLNDISKFKKFFKIN
jgi:hypothetical protein